MLNFASRARPYLGAVVLTVLLLTAGGIAAALRMPSGVYPEVTFPRIAVVAQAPTLALANMDVQVTQPLERELSTVSGVAQIRSKTIRGGSQLEIDFNPSTDMYRAKADTWNRIGTLRSELPADVALTVEQMTPSVNPIISVVLTGGDSPTQLRDYAFYQLAPQIKNIPDVLYANVAGGDLREIEVEARPDDLLAAGLSAADLADQIGKVHRLQPVGRIENPPFAFQLLVNTQGETVRKIEDLVIATRSNQPLRVRDVADVKIGHQDRVLSIGYGGHDAVVITVFRRAGGNSVNISRDINALLANLKRPGSRQMPRNIEATAAYDQAVLVSSAVGNVRDAIVVGSVFSVLILLVFLRSWRATLISALALPTTLAITLLIMYVTGSTFNLMSLGGLAVAIGLIIDDTVVVMENIARHLGRKDEGGRIKEETGGLAQTTSPPHPSSLIPHPFKDPVDAASGEITGAVVGSTLTTVLVFVPLAFIVGVYGQFFASLSWALSIAVLVSMVISLTLMPVCAAYFLAGRPMPEPGRIYNALVHIYELGLSVALRLPWVTLAVSLAAVGLGVLLYTGIPNPRGGQQPLVKGLETGLMPDMDEGAFTLDYWAPAGTPLERTEALVRQVEAVLSKNPDVHAYVRRTGAELGIFATQTSRGDIQVVLRRAEDDPISLLTRPVRPPLDQVEKEVQSHGLSLEDQAGKDYVRKKYRRRPVQKVMDEIEDEVHDIFGEHQLQVELMQIMQDELSDLSGASKPIEVKLFGPDHAVLRQQAEEVGELLEKNGQGHGLKEVNSNVREGNPDLMIEVDGARAAHVGLNAGEVERQLRTMFLGQTATQVRESAARITDVRVRYPDRLRFGQGWFDADVVRGRWLLLPDAATANAAPSGLATAPLVGPSRALPVAAVARVQPVRTPDEQWRENQQPAIFVTAELAPEEGGLGSAVAVVQRTMSGVSLPPGYHWEIGGHYLRQQEAFASLLSVMIVAIVLVYIMLAFQFRSVILPLLIFLTQPLSLVSGLFALWLTGTPLNVSSYMGAILLIGLDMKNGILLVEYIQQLRGEGMPLMPALLQAGRTRFRPILMTSLAAILGLFPLALGIGPGAQMQQPLAIMVIGGLTANMLFTRMVIPVGYLVLDHLGWTPHTVGS